MKKFAKDRKYFVADLHRRKDQPTCYSSLDSCVKSISTSYSFVRKSEALRELNNITLTGCSTITQESCALP